VYNCIVITIKKARASIKRLRTIVGVLIRDINRLLSSEQAAKYQEKFELFERVRKQQIKETNKILSLHEQHVYAITNMALKHQSFQQKILE